MNIGSAGVRIQVRILHCQGAHAHEDEPKCGIRGAMAKIRTNEEVKQTFRENFKTYGRDHGGHREGRMNLVEHTEYKYVNTDGSERTSRVRFNLEGQYGMAFVFAEVSDSMPSGEFVCVVVQDKRNGAVVNVGDNNNRSMLLARKMAGGSDAGWDVFARLLGTGGGGGGGWAGGGK